MHDRQLWNIRAKTQVSVGAQKNVCTMSLQGGGYRIIEPPKIEEGVARLWEQRNRLNVRAENELLGPWAVEKENEPGFRMIPGDSLQRMVGEPTDPIQFSRYQEPGIDCNCFSFHKCGKETDKPNSVLPIFEVPRAAILCI